MLTGPQLATAITAVLAGAIALGWILHWIWMRLSRAATSDSARIGELHKRMEAADRARSTAEKAKADAERDLADKTAEMEARMTEMQARLDGAVEGREAELERELREARIDAETSMSGLRNARERIMELEREIEALRSGESA